MADRKYRIVPAKTGPLSAPMHALMAEHLKEGTSYEEACAIRKRLDRNYPKRAPHELEMSLNLSGYSPDDDNEHWSPWLACDDLMPDKRSTATSEESEEPGEPLSPLSIPLELGEVGEVPPLPWSTEEAARAEGWVRQEELQVWRDQWQELRNEVTYLKQTLGRSNEEDRQKRIAAMDALAQIQALHRIGPAVLDKVLRDNGIDPADVKLRITPPKEERYRAAIADIRNSWTNIIYEDVSFDDVLRRNGVDPDEVNRVALVLEALREKQ